MGRLFFDLKWQRATQSDGFVKFVSLTGSDTSKTPILLIYLGHQVIHLMNSKKASK